jgi:small ligand-binding sensory domain FIST
VATAALSFSVRAETPARFASEAAAAVRASPGAQAGLFLLSGGLAAQAGDVARALAKAELGLPFLVASGAGVLSERGELERTAAGAGLVFRGGRPEALVADAATTDAAVEKLAGRLAIATRGRAATALVFARAEGFGIDSIEPVAAVSNLSVLGAGTTGVSPIFVVDREGELGEGRIGALLSLGLTPARVRVSPACRLLMPLRPITEARGPLVISIAGEPALDVLESIGSELQGQPLVLGVLAPPEVEATEGRTELAVRGIQGVDPGRRALVLSGDIRPGARFAFAVRDAGAARTNLERATRELARELQGSAPLFAVFMSCASRGSGLYGSPDVDVRVLRTTFPDLPIVGLHSAFEIAPHAGRTTLHYYTGVLGVFTAPS